MYERYHVPKNEMAPLGAPFSKSTVIRDDRCMNCGRCEDACIYGVHERSAKDPRVMAEPMSHLCKNCLRCVEDCPQRALSVELSKSYLELGDGLWTPQRVDHHLERGLDRQDPGIRRRLPGHVLRTRIRFHVDGHVRDRPSDQGRHPWQGVHLHQHRPGQAGRLS